MPDVTGQPLSGSRLQFSLTAADRDAADEAVIPPRVVFATLDEDASGSVELWPNDRGVTGTSYVVTALALDERNREVPHLLGFIEVPSDGPVDLSEILSMQPATPIGETVLAQILAVESRFMTVEGAVDDAVAAQEAAETAADEAAAERVAAETARDEAEALVTGAAVTAGYYDTIADGRAAVVDGATFGVLAGGSDGLTRATVYRRDSSSTQTEIVGLVNGAEFDDSRDDAGIHARAVAAAQAAGVVDPEPLSKLLTLGGYLDFVSTDYLFEGVTKADVNDFAAFAVARSAAAYALTGAGKYRSFGSNILRVTDLGGLIEPEAENLGDGSDFSAWVNFGGSTTLTTGQTPGPDEADAITGTLITGTGGQGRSRTRTFAASTYAVSYVFKPHLTALRFLINSISPNLRIDIDTSGAPTATKVTGASAIVPVLTALADGLFRLELTGVDLPATSFQTVWQANPAPSSGTQIVTLFHEQIETGSAVSSPVAGGATRPADEVTIDWSAEGLDSDVISIVHDGGSATFTRADLADPEVVDLVGDGDGSWLSRLIQSVTLIPTMPAAHRSIAQRLDDRSTALVASAIAPLRSAVSRLLATSGLSPVGAMTRHEAVTATQNGCTPIMVMRGGVVYWLDQVYGTEAAMLEASGGARDGQTVTWGYWTDGIDLLGGVDFSSGTEGFAGANGGAVAAVSGELEFTSSSLPDAFSRGFVGYGARALRYAGRCRRGTAGNTVPAFTRLNDYFGNGTLHSTITATVMTPFEIISTPGNGGKNEAVDAGWWIGGLQQGGAPGTAFYDDITLTEVWPFEGYPQGVAMYRLDGTAPSDLPSAAQVLLQMDTDDNSDRLRLEWRTDGSLWWIRDYYYGKSTGASRSEVEIGALAADEAFSILVGHSRTRLLGAINGAGAEIDLIGTIGASHMRIGRSYTGEAFEGTITGYAVYQGCETLPWMERETGTDTALPFTAKLPLILVISGDSYAINGSSGLGNALEDLGYATINLADGGTTSAQQAAVRAARTDLDGLPNTVEIWYDGSPNGFVDQTTARAEIAAWVGALGHNRWLYVRSGQIPNSVGISLKSEMDDLYEWVAYTYGAEHVFDPQPATVQFAISDPDAVGYADDQSDIAAGRFPRSQTYDGTHLVVAVRRAIALAMQPAIERVRGL